MKIRNKVKKQINGASTMRKLTGSWKYGCDNCACHQYCMEKIEHGKDDGEEDDCRKVMQEWLDSDEIVYDPGRR